MKKLLVIMVCAMIAGGCGKKAPSAKKEPMTATLTVDGTLTINAVAYVDGDPEKGHAHTQQVIKPDAENYDAWIQHLDIKPGESKEFRTWLRFAESSE